MKKMEQNWKREASERALGSLLLGSILLLAVLLIFPFTPGVFSQSLNNGTNYSVESRVNVTNALPTVKQVIIYRADSPVPDDIILNVGATTLVYCNATVQDRNGFEDLNLTHLTNATIFINDTGVTQSSPDDNNNHYTNTSCTSSQIDAENATVSCSFYMEYYADNHTQWLCNFTTGDLDGVIDFNLSEVKTLQPIFAINITTNFTADHSDHAIDFGNMAPGTTTPVGGDRTVNITNLGNINLSIAVDGWANVPGDNLAMNCTIGNISADNLRYNFTAGLAYADLYNVTANAPPVAIPEFTVFQRVDDGDDAKLASTNLTFWKLRVPIGVKGFCNGTVMFTAQ